MSDHDKSTDRSRVGVLALAALGVVYGDIGTSPLYAMRESFESPGHSLGVTDGRVLGILSLILWSLIIVISIKYLAFVMKADNDGEGGILVMTSLIPRPTNPGRWRKAMVLLGLFGTALLYGDGMITPAISVLSAVEGTEIATPALAPYAIPIASVILVLLFSVQRFGTGGVGRMFGPVMILWFGTLGTLGLIKIIQNPDVLQAINPIYGLNFFLDNGLAGFISLGSVFLVVTGGEALYADMGHFGRRPIVIGWFGLVLPGLLLNYFGQGALLISNPEAIEGVGPFYRMVPPAGAIPLMILATAATIIASQALISGVFSLSMQAAQFGYLPRMRVINTSPTERGQIYVPAMNWALMIACVALVVGFGSSSRLAAAYGIAVTMTMVITTLLYYLIARETWKWPLWKAGLLCSGFLVVDLAFFGANIQKIPAGGWFPLVVGAIGFAVVTTWYTGRKIIRERTHRGKAQMSEYLKKLRANPPQRVRGTAVYLFGIPGAVPPPLYHNVSLTDVLQEDVYVVSVITDRVPYRHTAQRVRAEDLGEGITQVTLHYGFMQEPDVAQDLRNKLEIEPEEATYYIGRDTVVVTPRHSMARWREHLFVFIRKNARDAASYFKLPADRVIEISARVEL